MAVIRTYACDGCEKEWEYWHDSGDEESPPCPNCEGITGRWVPQRFNMKGTHSKAMDITQGIMEKEFGMTDWKDNTQPGETVVKPNTISKEDAEKKIRQDVEAHAAMKNSINPNLAKMADSFFVGSAGGSGAGAPSAPFGNQQMASVAAAASRQARKEGASPIELLHNGIKSGKNSRANYTSVDGKRRGLL